MLERNPEAIEYVLHEARKNDVKFIRLWFTDILGSLKGFATTVNELESAMTRGMGFDGSTIEGFARSDERDLFALPDPNTFSILPWRPRTNAACNPYLAFSVMLAAGLEGIENEYELPPPVESNVDDMKDEERESRGIESLPGNLWEAIRIAEQSELVHKALGENVFRSFMENKKIEWDRYRSQVTDYEIDRYLPIL